MHRTTKRRQKERLTQQFWQRRRSDKQSFHQSSTTVATQKPKDGANTYFQKIPKIWRQDRRIWSPQSKQSNDKGWAHGEKKSTDQGTSADTKNWEIGEQRRPSVQRKMGKLGQIIPSRVRHVPSSRYAPLKIPHDYDAIVASQKSSQVKWVNARESWRDVWTFDDDGAMEEPEWLDFWVFFPFDGTISKQASR